MAVWQSAAASLVAAMAGGGAWAAEVPMISAGVGAFGLREEPPSASVELQLRGAPFLWKLAPQGGLMVAAREGVYVWAGLEAEIPLGPGLALTPAIGIGLYDGGNGKVLGYPLEFRSSLELAWSPLPGLLPPGGRLGLQVYHLSNAGLAERNPGAEGVMLNLHLPLTPAPPREAPPADQ